jgi:hypothetical protein
MEKMGAMDLMEWTARMAPTELRVQLVKIHLPLLISFMQIFNLFPCLRSSWNTWKRWTGRTRWSTRSGWTSRCVLKMTFKLYTRPHLVSPSLGPPGTDGKDGKDGVDGKDGKDGQPGLPGPPGLFLDAWQNPTSHLKTIFLFYFHRHPG